MWVIAAVQGLNIIWVWSALELIYGCEGRCHDIELPP